jgi:hypothetical protein
MALLGLLRLSLVRALLLAILRSRLGRKALRAGFRAVGRERILRLARNTLPTAVGYILSRRAARSAQ